MVNNLFEFSIPLKGYTETEKKKRKFLDLFFFDAINYNSINYCFTFDGTLRFEKFWFSKASPYELQATRYVLENKTSNYG